jgi:hypothetical protein
MPASFGAPLTKLAGVIAGAIRLDLRYMPLCHGSIIFYRYSGLSPSG